MNATAIAQLAQSTIDGSMPFPEIIKRLMQEGAESYRLDNRALRFTFYGAAGGVVVAPLCHERQKSLGAVALLKSVHQQGRGHVNALVAFHRSR